MTRWLAFLLVSAVMVLGCGSKDTADTTKEQHEPAREPAAQAALVLSAGDYAYAHTLFINRSKSGASHTQQEQSCGTSSSSNSMQYYLYASCLAQIEVNSKGAEIQACGSVSDQAARLQCLVPAFSELSQALQKSYKLGLSAQSVLGIGPCYELLFKPEAEKQLGEAANNMLALLTSSDTTTAEVQKASEQLASAGVAYDRANHSPEEVLSGLPQVCR